MNTINSPLGVCVFPEKPDNAARGVHYPHYIHEILAHAGIGYNSVEMADLEEHLPGLRVLVTVGETDLSDSLKEHLREWVQAGGNWLSIAGLCGLGDLLGADYVSPTYRGSWGGSLACTLGEGYLQPTEDSHPLLEHLSIPLHFFNGIAAQAITSLPQTADGKPTILARVLNKHGRETSQSALIESQVGQGRCLLIAPDVMGAVVRIQQGVGITRDGVPASDGTAPVSDGVLKCGDGAVLDWYFDRQDVPGVPGLKGFLQPIADQWRELLLRSLFYMAAQQQIPLPVLWLYPRNLPALAHMSHDTDNNVPELGQKLLEVVEQAQIRTTWCVIAPGYPRELISSIHTAGHELAMHYDAMSKDCPWSEQLFDEQWHYLQDLFGLRPVTNKNHYTRWEGDTEFFEWCLKRDIELDQSKGPSKTGEVGFTFGSCHPYFPVAPDGEVLDVLELPLLTQDFAVFVPKVVLAPLLEATLRHHGVMHLLFHPGHIGKPEVEIALLESVTAATDAGMEWWTAQQLNAWERARRTARWNMMEQQEAEYKSGLHVEDTLQDATLLFLSQESMQPLINDQSYSTTTVMRWGFTFQTVTLDLEAGTDYCITLQYSL